jgi:hypothetical protein
VKSAIVVDETDGPEGLEYMRKMYLRSKDTVGRLGGRIEKAEREVRDMTKDRDHWRDRAERAEAELRSRYGQA